MQELIKKIHGTVGSFEIAVTGGGTSAITQLLAVPGASRSVLNAVIPYSDTALASYLGARPNKACSADTARLLATRAFHNARQLKSGPVLGIGATAALQTDRTRRGEDQLYVAVQTETSSSVYHLPLPKTLTRAEQEQLCAATIISAIAQQLDLPLTTSLAPIDSAMATPEIQRLMLGAAQYAGDNYRAIFPGAFNPPHDGHFRIRDIAERKLQQPVAFEISAFNVDKPPLDYIDINRRQQLLSGYPLVFTRAATFLEKAKVFPGATFVVGADTLIRIDEPRYYGDSVSARDAALAYFTTHGHRFLVFGRVVADEFETLSDLSLSPALSALCDEVPEREFREDVSSSAIRDKEG